MNRPASGWNDTRLDQILGNLLRLGVLTAAAIVLLGGCVFLARHGSERMPSYREFHGERALYRNVGAIVRGVLDGRGRGIIQFGLLVLIATPVARVVFSVIAFALERDYLYVAVTVSVLIVLLCSLFTAGQ